MLHFRIPLALAAIATLLSACGGGGGGSSPIPSTGGGAAPTQPAQKTGPASLTVYIPPPGKQNTHFRPNYISAATQSMTVGLVSGTTTSPLATINLTQSSPNCTVPAGGGLQCTATVQAPFGTDTFSVSTYSLQNGTGNLLSTGQIQETLQFGGTEPTVDVSLNGVPSTVSLVLGTASLPVGTAGSTAVIVQALDGSGNLIIGPGVFATPISLAISGDTYHTLLLSTSSVTSPGQVVTLNYNGGTNVGSTITPSGSGITGTAVSFAGSGAVLNLFQYYDGANGVYGYPHDVAAFPLGTTPSTYVGDAAVLMEIYSAPMDTDYYGVGIASPAGAVQSFVGDTSDPYNVPAPGSLTIPGVTVVHGMSSSLETEEFDSYDDIATGSNGLVYYSGHFSSSSAPSCEEQTEESGTIGALNASGGTTTERVVNGYPGPIKVDNAGNVWFIEDTGSCGEGNLLASQYAIGEWHNAPAGTITETPFSAAGLSGISYPADMSITPDGSEMFIVDDDNSTVTKIATATLSSPVSITPTSSAYPETVATATDGTTAWWGDEDPFDNYFYGFVPSSKPFTTANISEEAFPINYFYSYDMTFGDGSFWIAGEEYATGIGRLSGLSAGSPANGYYAMPTQSEGDDDCDGGQSLEGISAGAGNVWAVDDDCYNFDILQYGVPSSGVVTYTAVRHFGAINTRRNTHAMPKHRAKDPRPHAVRKSPHG